MSYSIDEVFRVYEIYLKLRYIKGAVRGVSLGCTPNRVGLYAWEQPLYILIYPLDLDELVQWLARKKYVQIRVVS